MMRKGVVEKEMEYADVIWDGCSIEEANLLEAVQYESARIVTGAIRGTNRNRLLEELCWEDLKTRRHIHKLSFFYKIITHTAPSYLCNLLPPYVNQRSIYFLRSNNNLTNIFVRTEQFKKYFFPSAITAWNDLINNCLE